MLLPDRREQVAWLESESNLRYLIDPEFRVKQPPPATRYSAAYAGDVRREICERNRLFAFRHGHAHEETLGRSPAVLYREDEAGRHGNFLPESLRCMRQNAAWHRRLNKVHTTARRVLLSHDRHRRELDSCNSSDALLMNIFCHPATMRQVGVQRLLQVSAAATPEFGHRPRTTLSNGRKDATEVDMKLETLLIEAKLTEYDFQQAPLKLLERYEAFDLIFDQTLMDRRGDRFASYQLIRAVMAVAPSADLRFGVMFDQRRPDLLDRWHQTLSAVRAHDLRCRLFAFTWQEIAAVLPIAIQSFLLEKYGIAAA